jgi:hypothetical protein
VWFDEWEIKPGDSIPAKIEKGLEHSGVLVLCIGQGVRVGLVAFADLSYAVARWPRAEQFRIMPPALDPDSCYNGRQVVAAFHTHPNPAVDEAGREWEQGPSASDRRWHERRSLPGFVVSQLQVYEISGRGLVSIVGLRDEVLS